MTDIGWVLTQIERAPEIKPLIQAYNNEMTENGYPTRWKNSDIFFVMFITVDGDPVAFICHAPIEKTRCVHITGAWTKPEYRRLGVYSMLFDLFVRHYRHTGNFDNLWSGYNSKNIASANMQTKQGREVREINGEHRRTWVDLTPVGDESQITEADLMKFIPLVAPEPVIYKLKFKDRFFKLFGIGVAV